MAAPPSTSVPVAPFIAQTVGDPGRPHAGLPATTDLRHLPGKSGLLASLANLRGTMRNGVDHMRAQVAAYGRVYRMPMGLVPAVWIADPDALSEISRNERRVWSAALGWRLLFEGLDPERVYLDFPGSVDFEAHKDIRRLLQPGFNAAALDGYIASTLDVVAPEVERWLAAGRVPFKPVVRRLFATIANRVFLGITDPEQTTILDRAMAAFWRGPLAVTKRAWLSPTWRRARRGFATLRDALRSQAAERRASTRTDLFSRVCRVAPDIGWVDDDTLAGIYLGVMAAAFDTTSLGVTSMAYALATHPDWQDKLAAEARAAPEPIDGDALKKLELCDRAWRETLRRYPVASSLPRRALCDLEIAGHKIPAGAMVLAQIAVLSHDPEIWTEPGVFDPDRFSPERAEDRRRRGAYLPFGAGPHACLGAQLSTMEAKAFWYATLRRARIRLARPYAARHEFTPLGCVSGEVELVFEPR